MQKVDTMHEKMEKFREERCAREKARLEKLRQLNLQRVTKSEFTLLPKVNRTTVKPAPSTKAQSPPKSDTKISPKPSIKPTDNSRKFDPKLPTQASTTGLTKTEQRIQIKKPSTSAGPGIKPLPSASRKSVIPQKANSAPLTVRSNPVIKKYIPNPPKASQNISQKSTTSLARKSIIPQPSLNGTSKAFSARKSMAPTKTPQPTRKNIAPRNDSKESVFDRLYKPKMVASKPSIPQTNPIKPQTNPPLRSNNTIPIRNKRHTVFEPKPAVRLPVRRSISAVHFKRISRNELANCIHKWASTNNLNRINMKNTDEDATVLQDRLVSAVKSERKRVQFKTSYSNLNTPKPEELQSRLKSWLEKRGKSINSYHHLQCFGLHHQAETAKEFKPYDEEDKENVAADSDSDDGSFCETMNDNSKWRRASCVSGIDESQDTIESEELVSDVHNADDLYLGALKDLTELVKEGYDWEQSARWLRVIRTRCPPVADTATYWECRAILEERRGDFPSTLNCWEEALANGSKSTVVEANLDQLLDKFMQLKISPASVKKLPVTPKMLDVKNIFKSTLLRFAVQEAKTRQSQSQAQFTVTPVRRSNRTARHSSSKRPPLVQICSTIPSLGKDAHFVANRTLPLTP